MPISNELREVDMARTKLTELVQLKKDRYSAIKDLVESAQPVIEELEDNSLNNSQLVLDEVDKSVVDDGGQGAEVCKENETNEDETTVGLKSTRNFIGTTTTLEWVFIGEFETNEEVQRIRKGLKVSINKSTQQLKGLKNLYKCSRRRTDNCDFQLYTMQPAHGWISVYRHKSHNHSITAPRRTGIRGRPKTAVEVNGFELATVIAPGDAGGDDRVRSTMQTAVPYPNEATIQSLLSLINPTFAQPPNLNESMYSDISYDAPGESDNSTPGELDIIKEVVHSESPQSTASTASLKRKWVNTNFERLPNLRHSAPLDDSLAEAITGVSAESQQLVIAKFAERPAVGDITPPNHQITSNRIRKQLKPVRSAVIQPRSQPSYSLSESLSATRLIEIASELNLTVMFNARKRVEYCFSAGSGDSQQQKSVVVSDTGAATVAVEEKVGGKTVDAEEWIKGDLAQFAWAIKAKCRRALLS